MIILWLSFLVRNPNRIHYFNESLGFFSVGVMFQNFPLLVFFQLSVDLQYQICEVIKSLVRTERNQQVMCEAGLPHELLTRATVTLADEQHTFHPPLQYVFERLAAQSLTPKDLRLYHMSYFVGFSFIGAG